MPKFIVGKDYEKYHPGHVEQTSKDKAWDGLLFTRYSHPRHCNGSPRPATNDHLLAFANNGAVKGDYSFNEGKWRPYTWRQGEWLIGQAYGNKRDSRWHSLCDNNVELSVCYIHLAPKILQRVALEATDQNPVEIELPHKMSFRDPFMFQLGLALKNETEQDNPYGKIFVESAANLLAVHLLREYCAQPFRVKDYSTKVNLKRFERVLEYIHYSHDQEISLNKMAQLANMSSYHFARLFKQTTGSAPHQYVMDVRITKAKELLQKTNIPITQIALQIGYSVNHFVQIFKRYTGQTPSSYRKRFKK